MMLCGETMHTIHDPHVSTGLALRQGFKACASGYSEAVKRHLAYLVHLLGGTLTDTLRRINTHLFVPCRAGPKYASVVKCVYLGPSASSNPNVEQHVHLGVCVANLAGRERCTTRQPCVRVELHCTLPDAMAPHGMLP